MDKFPQYENHSINIGCPQIIFDEYFIMNAEDLAKKVEKKTGVVFNVTTDEFNPEKQKAVRKVGPINYLVRIVDGDHCRMTITNDNGAKFTSTKIKTRQALRIIKSSIDNPSASLKSLQFGLAKEDFD
jgi:hypothetical protein